MKKEKYLISIIVPAYNIADYLPRCLDSILDQTYSNLEVIVISDGSTDGTNEIIMEYAEKDRRIVPIYKENSGVSDTRNKGLEIAKGDYIGFIDGDDYIEPEMYEVLLKNALDNDADISHCGYQMVFPSRVDYYYNTGKKVIQDNKKGIRDLIVGDYVEPSPCIKIYRRKVLDGLRMPDNIRINEDVLFNFYAFCNSNKSVYDDIPFYHYILRKDSATKTKINDNLLFDPIKVSREMFFVCYKKYNELTSIAYKRFFYTIVRAYRTINIKNLKEKLEIVDSYKYEFSNVNINFSLSHRQKIEKFCFFHFPKFYLGVYKFYDKYISKNINKYEVK